MPMRIQRDIAKLKQQMLEMSVRVEEVFSRTIRCVKERDAAAAQVIIDGDRALDIAEVDLEEECLKTLALNQPVATDLRFIVAVLKINNDLERIGDLAVNIAERVLTLADHAEVPLPFDFNRMSGIAQIMLHRSIEALVNLDKGTAYEVLAQDREIDTIHREMYRAASKEMCAKPGQIESLLHGIAVSRYLERIADHATNIAEDVIYLVDGEIVRHHIGEGPKN